MYDKLNSLEVTQNQSLLKEKRRESVVETMARSLTEQSFNYSSMFTSILNIMNTIIGAGILALPFVIMNFGIVFGSLIIIFVYLLTIYSCKLLIDSKNASNQVADYGLLGRLSLGKKGEIFLKLLILFNNFGVSVSYCIIFGSSLNKILIQALGGAQNQTSFFLARQFYQILGGLLILPFAFAKSTEKLKFASFLTILSVLIFSILTIYNFFNKLNNNGIPNTVNFIPSPSDFKIPNALSSFSTIFLAFTFHFNFFPVYSCLENNTDKRMMKTSIFSLTLVVIIYLCIGIAGYASYGNGIEVNFLEAFTYKDLGNSFYLLYICFSFVPLFSIPVCFFEARNYILSLSIDFKNWREEKKREREEKLVEKTSKEEINTDRAIENFEERVEGNKNNTYIVFQNRKKNNYYFILVSYFFFVLIFFLGILVTNLSVVFSFIGAIGSNAVVFILPATFYAKLTTNRNYKYKAAICLIIFGFISGTIAIISEIIRLTI